MFRSFLPYLFAPLIFCLPFRASAVPEVSIIPAVPQGSAPAAQAPAKKSLPEKIQEAQQLIKDAQTTLTRMQSAETTNALALAGLPSGMQSELILSAGNAVQSFQRYAESLKKLDRLTKNAEARQSLADAGDNSPLNSNTDISLIRDRFNATQQALAAATSELQILEDSTQEAANLLPKLDQAIRQASDKPTEADNWRSTLAKLQRSEAEALMLANDTRKKILLLQIDVLKKDSATDKKLLQQEATAVQAGGNSEALARLDKERSEVTRKLQVAVQRDQKAKAALDKTRENYLKVRDTGPNAELARQQYDLAQTEAETAEEIIDSSRVYLQIIDTEIAQWKYIGSLKGNISLDELQKGINSLNRQLELVRKWKPQLEQEIRSKQLALETLKNRLEENKSTDRAYLNEKMERLQEQVNLQQHLLWRVETFNSRLLDWVDQLKKMAPHQPFRNSFKEILSGVYTTLRNAINYEVFSFKETEMIAGNQVVVGERSVTIARIVLALAFFILGYQILTKWSRFIVRLAQTRFQIPVARTALLEKVLLYLMAILLVLCALSWARIPLTIFAYLGGALAIGVGFGAQNLISNFISGIILLFERQINVGDIVEVNGNIGEVIALGNRCSRLRRADGVEMLVPNSMLLEKNVINWTLSDLDHRFDFTFSVAYGSPLDKVIRLVQQAFTETPNILRHPIPVVFFEKFGDSGLVFGVYYWVRLYKGLDAREIGSNLRMLIDQLCRNEGVNMPFPQQDVHFNSPVRVQLEPPETPTK